MKISRIMSMLAFEYNDRTSKMQNIRRQIQNNNIQESSPVFQQLINRLQVNIPPQIQAIIFYKIIDKLIEDGKISPDEEWENLDALQHMMGEFIQEIEQSHQSIEIADALKPDEKYWVKPLYAHLTSLACQDMRKKVSDYEGFAEVIDRVLNELSPIKNTQKARVSPALYYLHNTSGQKKKIQSFVDDFLDETKRQQLLNPRAESKKQNPTLIFGEFTVAQAMRRLAAYSMALEKLARADSDEIAVDSSWLNAWSIEAKIFYIMMQKCVHTKLVKLNQSVELCPFEEYYLEFDEKMRTYSIPATAFSGAFITHWENKNEWELGEIMDEVNVLMKNLEGQINVHLDRQGSNFAQIYRVLHSFAREIFADVESHQVDLESSTSLTI